MYGAAARLQSIRGTSHRKEWAANRLSSDCGSIILYRWWSADRL